ncbi:MAG: leishmanolysin-related zinc metalloendopeptidase, partial [Rhodopila sp.]
LLSYGDAGTPGNVSAPVVVGSGGWLDFKFLFSGTNVAGENRIYAVNQNGELLSYGDAGTPGNVSAPVVVGSGGWLDFKFLFSGTNVAGENRIYAVTNMHMTPYTIEVRFLGGLTESQKNAFTAAADRWSQVIVGDLPSVAVDGEIIDDLLILAQGADIDGPGKILGQAGPTHLRPGNAGAAAFLPAKGKMIFDSADLAQMETAGTLNDVITHEMGHVIGIGIRQVWRNLLQGAGTTNPTFTGNTAKKEYGDLRGTGPTPVPVENTGGPGTRDSHWREAVFGNELMTGFVGSAGNPLCRMTVGSLQDVGYTVDLGAAEPYTLPNHLELAERGAAAVHESEGIVLPNIPMILPEDSLV